MLERALEFAKTNLAYVDDFERVWQATTFLAAGRPATRQEARAAANALVAVLRNWGAGRRRAPSPAEPDTVASFFTDAVECRRLGRLRQGQRNAMDGRLRHDYHTDAIEALNSIARAIFIPATHGLVYPAKMLMLLTGIGPAPDSRLRAGLAVLGVRGWSSTQQLLPTIADQDRLIELWNWAGARCRDEWPQVGDALLKDQAIAWVIAQGAYGRLVDMALFAIGKGDDDGEPPADGAPAAGQRWPGPAAVGGTGSGWTALATWAGRSTFEYRRHANGGYDIRFGHGQTVYVSPALLDALVRTFGNKSLPLGTSRTAPPPNSLGAWLQRHLVPTATASYIGPLLVEIGLAAKSPYRSADIVVFAVRQGED